MLQLSLRLIFTLFHACLLQYDPIHCGLCSIFLEIYILTIQSVNSVVLFVENKRSNMVNKIKYILETGRWAIPLSSYLIGSYLLFMHHNLWHLQAMGTKRVKSPCFNKHYNKSERPVCLTWPLTSPNKTLRASHDISYQTLQNTQLKQLRKASSCRNVTFYTAYIQTKHITVRA